MINSEFMNEEAKVFAEYLQKVKPDNPFDQVSVALSRVLQRVPTKSEVDRGLALMNELKANDNVDQREALRLFCLVTMNLNEFLFLD